MDNTNPINSTALAQEKKPKQNTIVYILSIIIVLLLSLILYLYFTDRIVLDKDTATNDNNKEELKQYTFEHSDFENSFTLMYPESWNISKDKTTCLEEEGICIYHDLVLTLYSNPNYTFSLNTCSECQSEHICSFSDSNYSDNVFAALGIIEYDSFEEFDEGVYRRAKMNDSNEITICELFDDGTEEWYASGKYNILYDVPENPDKDILKVMDDIVLSIESL